MVVECGCSYYNVYDSYVESGGIDGLHVSERLLALSVNMVVCIYRIWW